MSNNDSVYPPDLNESCYFMAIFDGFYEGVDKSYL